MRKRAEGCQALANSERSEQAGTEGRWARATAIGHAPTPAVAQPRKASSDNASGVNAQAREGEGPGQQRTQ